MGTNLIKSFLETGKDIINNQVADISNIINTSAVLDVKDVLNTIGVLRTVDDKENNDADDQDLNRMLIAQFVLCTSKVNENETSDSLLKDVLVLTFQNMVNGIFKQVFEINTNFTFFFCKDNKLPEGLNFTNLEDFETKRDDINSYNATRYRDKKYTNKTTLDRGIRVIEILPESSDLTLHSNAEKSGIVAHIYLHHLNLGGFRNDNGKTVQQFINLEFDITIIHEICHLLGLSDRYQFLLTYKLDQSGDCIESITRTLIPYAVDPKLDEEALDPEKVLNNLMYGEDNFCRGLTSYQRKVILGYLDPEPKYDKASVLIPDGSSFSTNTYNGRARKRIGLSSTQLNDPPLVGVDPSLGTFTYTDVEGTLSKDFSGKNIKFNGKAVGDTLNEVIGIVVLDDSKNIQTFSNKLGKDISNLSYCDSRTINPIKSQSNGN